MFLSAIPEKNEPFVKEYKPDIQPRLNRDTVRFPTSRFQSKTVAMHHPTSKLLLAKLKDRHRGLDNLTRYLLPR